MSRTVMAKTLFAVITGAITVVSGVQFYQHRHHQLPIVAGPGVTRVVDLSKYGAGLKGTMADTKVFFLEGKEPGGKALVMANTHANEPDGILAALIFIENALVEKRHAHRHSAVQQQRQPLHQARVTAIRCSMKSRRRGEPRSSGSAIAVHHRWISGPTRMSTCTTRTDSCCRFWMPGTQTEPGRDARTARLMERVTDAVMRLLKQERVDIAIDVHGAETMFPVTNCIVAPEKSMRIATMASLTVTAMEGFENHVEPSPQGFRGLSHREIGDYSETLPFLLEAPFPFLDQPTGPKTAGPASERKRPVSLEPRQAEQALRAL